MQGFSGDLAVSFQQSAIRFLLIAITPEDPGEGSPGAQNGEGKGEEALFEVLTPCGIDEEPSGDGGQREKKGQDEHGFASGALIGGVCRGFFAWVRYADLRSYCLEGSVEVFSGFFSAALPAELPFVPGLSPLAATLSGVSVFVPLL